MYDSRYDAAVKFNDHREDDVEFVGSTTKGNPMFFDTATRSVFEGEYDEADETVVDVPETERELEPRETLGETLEDLGDDLDWDSLSEFAREHVQRDEDE